MRLVNSLSVRDLGPISSITVDTKLKNIVTGLESNQELLFLANKTMLGYLVMFLNWKKRQERNLTHDKCSTYMIYIMALINKHVIVWINACYLVKFISNGGNFTMCYSEASGIEKRKGPHTQKEPMSIQHKVAISIYITRINLNDQLHATISFCVWGP